MRRFYDLLSNDEIRKIHEASLDVLQTTGLRINHAGALERLSDAGAQVDAAKEQVRLPADMVEKTLKLVPNNFICAGRTPDFDVSVRADATAPPIIRSGAGAINHYDFLSNVYRLNTIRDCQEFARLADALENIDIVGTPTPQDAPPQTADLHVLHAMLEAGRKHIWATVNNSRNLKYQFEMMTVVAGGRQALQKRPLFSGVVCLVEPFFFPRDEIDRLLMYGEYNLPVKVPLIPVAGVNAPYTLAGVLTKTNTEALGSLVLLQTLCPGIPTWYYNVVQDMQMHSGNVHFMNPEIMLINSGLIQLARYYGIPSATLPYANASGEPHEVMFEHGGALALYALSGATELGGAGFLEAGLVMSPLALLIDSEIAAFARRLVEGLEIDKETLAMEAINRVGHGGNFLSDDHTLRFLRRERRFKPTLFDWRPLRVWSKNGKSILEKAQDKMNDILEKHEVPPLDELVHRELDHILQAADKES